MDILLASGNLHKKKELSGILSGHNILLPTDLNLSFEFDETGSTFAENALGKAQHLFQAANGIPVIADDSGLCVDALKGEPGLYSARYGSIPGEKPLTDKERNALLLKNLGNATDRTARFVCAMALVFDLNRFFIVQETVEGSITEKEFGGGGFGYDPVFYLPDYKKTMAEIPAEEKNRISHRGKAGRRIASLLV